MDYQTLSKAFGAVLSDKDPLGNSHGNNVAELVMKCIPLYMPDIEQDIKTMIYYGAMLHDMGKIYLSDSLLSKAGKLTKQEYEIVKTHVLMGHALAVKLELHPIVYDIILYHHENENGSGYLKNKKGVELPWYVALVHIADSYDAMTNERSYRKARTKEQANKELDFGRDKLYNSRLVDIFQSVV